MWIKIRVDTGAGKTAWPPSITHGKTIPGDSDLTFRTATASECMLWVATIGDPISEFEVFKRRFVNHCCLLDSTRRRAVSLCCMVTKGYMFHKGLNVAKKIDAWIQKDLRDSQYRGCTVAYKDNNVHNIYMKPRGNKIDAVPLSRDSESEGCRPGPNL